MKGKMLRIIKSLFKRSHKTTKLEETNQGIDLSVIVPVYNVENYVAFTLESLLAIHEIKIEIVVVDDGSRDNSMTIVRDFARMDRRVKIVVQENAGLGAARNRGITESKGRYVAFIDSDDLVETNALEQFVQHLDLTGSDLAVGHYRHLANGALKPAGRWILDVHRRTETATLASRPDVLVNAIVCSKVFRRSFWNKSGLSFPVGVLYEDQDVSTLAYARAKAFDIMAISLIQWRRRETGDSITQQTAQPNNLVDRFASADRSLQVLKDNGYPSAVAARALEYLANNTFTLAKIANDDDEYWEVLRRSLPKLRDTVSEEEFIRRVSAPDRALYHCISQNLRKTAVQIASAGGRNIHSWKLVRTNSEIFLQWPDKTLGKGFPRSALVLGRRDHQLEGTIDEFDWEGLNTLRVSGSVYLSGTDVTLSRSITVVLVDEEVGFGFEISAVPKENEREQGRSDARFRDLTNSGFELLIPLDDLLTKMSERDISQLNLDMLFTVEEGGIQRSGSVTRRAKTSTAQTILADFPDKKSFVRPSWNKSTGLRLNVRPAIARVDAVRTTANGTEISIRMGNGKFEPIRLLGRSRPPKSTPVYLGDVHKRSDGLFVVDLPPSMERDDSVNAQFELLVEDHKGRTRLLHSSAFDSFVGLEANGFHFDRTHTSRVLITPKAGISQNWRIKALGPNIFEVKVDVPDYSDTSMYEIALEGPGGSVRTAVQNVVGKTLTFVVNESGAQQNLSMRTGLYSMELFRDDYRLSTPLSQSAVWSKGSTVDCGRWSVAPCLVGYDRIGLEVQPNKLISSSSEYELTKLKTRYWESSVSLTDSIYFQCLKGDQANDNQLQLALEFTKNFPEMRVVWGVQDESIRVPSGQQRTIIGGPEYFEAIAAAKILCFNHEVPEHFRKRAGQLFVQTYHGHPFKLMGMKAWEHKKKTVGEIERGLRARAIWDVLVSPNEIATKHYRENYPLDYDVIETGHPRNDPLANASRERTQSLRERLGIPSGTKAVLYAPTYRDVKSSDPWSSPIVEFFDPAQFAKDLGDDYCVLLRGHPANARFDPSAKQANGVIDVTLHPDINDLILACDIGVFDYSSLRFDFAVTGKPMYFFVPDIVEYFELTPSLFQYEESIVGEIIMDYGDLVSAVASGQSGELLVALEEYRQTFAPNDDGQAAKRVAEALMSRIKR